MVSAKLLQIFAVGPQDKKLYGNPQITFFKTVYKRHTNFGTNYICKDINKTNVDFDKTIRFKIPREGDLLGGIYLRVKLSLSREINFNDNSLNISRRKEPQYTSLVNGIGAIFIENISLKVGGKELESFTGEWIFIDNELYNEQNNKDNFYKSIYYNQQSFLIGNRSPEGNLQEGNNINDVDILIPIPFFFTKDTGLFLPMCAMNDETIEIELKIRSKEKCLIRRKRNNLAEPDLNSLTVTATPTTPVGTIYKEAVDVTIDKLDVIYKFYYLGNDEKQFFLNKSHEYIIPKVTTQNSNDFSNPGSNTLRIPTEFKHPTKFLVWTIQRKSIREENDYFNFTYQNNLLENIYGYLDHIPDNNKYILDEFNLEINGYNLLDQIPSKILNNVELYSNFKNNSNILFYLYSFSLFPKDVNPTGTLNFSRIKNQVLKLKITNPNIADYSTDNFICQIYSVHYNILKIKDGLSGLAFL